MISVASVAVLGLTIASLLSLATAMHEQGKDRLEGELAAARAERLFRSFFSQAVDVEFTPRATAAYGFALPNGVNGWIRDGIDYDQIADMGADDFRTLALFWREEGVGNGTTIGSPRKSAIWYRRPSRTTSGVLIFGGGPANGSAAALVPSTTYGDSYVDRVSAIKITKSRSNVGVNKTTSVDVTVRVRYHPRHANGFNWCPATDIKNAVAACVTDPVAVYADIERSFRVVLQNGLLKSAGAFTSFNPTDKEERVMGNIYFFKLIAPQRM